MTKDILLTISGLHETDGESDEPVEIITPGQYFLKNGKHYVLFDEVMEGVEGEIKSKIKISDDQVELIRKGAATARMVFQEAQEHIALYHTPMGPLSISVYTESICKDIGENEITVEIIYSIKAQEQIVTESRVSFQICPKELKKFEN